MRKALLTILLVAISNTPAYTDSIELSALRSLTVETKPRSNVTLVVKVHNNSNERRTVNSILELPDLWSEIIGSKPLTIDPGQSKTSIVSLFVPQETRTGSYNVSYKAFDSTNVEPVAELDFDIHVLPHLAIETRIVNAPPYVTAGETIPVSFAVMNRSNTSIEAEITISGGYGFQIEIDDINGSSIFLEPGEVKRLSARVMTRKDLERLVDYRLKVEAKAAVEVAGEAITASDHVNVEIIPVVSRSKTPVLLFPLDVSINHVGEVGVKPQSITTLRLGGEGPLDASARHWLDFEIASQLSFPDPTIPSENDIYNLAYSNEVFGLELGDNDYEVSPLLGTKKNGRGIRARVHQNRVGLSTFYYYGPISGPDDSFVGGNFNYYGLAPAYRDGYKYRTNLNLFGKIDEYLILSYLQNYKPVPENEFTVETAIGRELASGIRWAGMIAGSGNVGSVSYDVTGQYAQPGFPGSYSDRYYIDASAGLDILPDLHVGGGFRQERQNLQLDESEGNAPLTRSLKLESTVTEPASEINFSLLAKTQYRTDLLPSDSFESRMHTLRLGVNVPLAPITLRGSTRWDISSRVDEDYGSVNHQHRLTAYMKRSPDSTYEVFGDVDAYYSEIFPSSARFQLGFATTQRSRKLSWDLSFANSFYVKEGEYKGLGIFLSAGTRFRLSDKHDIVLDASYELPSSTEPQEQEFSLKAGFKTRAERFFLGTRDTGTIKGYVYSKSTEEPVRNAIVRVANRAAVTDDDGEFALYGIEGGNYHLTVDAGRTDTNLVPEVETPIDVHVDRRKTARVEIPMIKGARVEGVVSLYDVKESRSGMLSQRRAGADGLYADEDVVRTGGYSGVLVAIKKGDSVHRTISDSNGKFSFTDILPGRWVLTVVNSPLSEKQRFVDDEISFEVEPGETGSVELKIYPVQKSVTILETPRFSLGGKKDEKVEDTVDTADRTASAGTAESGDGTRTTAETRTIPDTRQESTADEEDDRIAKLRRDIELKYVDRDTEAPRLLRLDWGSSPDEAEETLLSRKTGFQPLEPVPASEAQQLLDIDVSEGAIVFRTIGAAQYGLEGLVVLSFLNTGDSNDQRYLYAAKIHISAVENNRSREDLTKLFDELLVLFTSRWKLSQEGLYQKQRYAARVSGIQTAYEIERNDGNFTIYYEDTWLTQRRSILASIMQEVKRISENQPR